MKKILLLLSALQTVALAKPYIARASVANEGQQSANTVSDDSFELVKKQEMRSDTLYDISSVYEELEEYDGNVFVKLVDSDHGYDKRPRSAPGEYVTYGENNDQHLQAYDFCALYKCGYKQYRRIVSTSDVVNPAYESIGVNIQDSTSSSISASVSTEIGAGFGDFIEAGVRAGLCTEFGMEVGSSFGVEFGFNPKFTAQEKIFDLYVYEVREYFLVITYTAHVVTVRKSNGGILWWRKEWDEIDYISYTRKVYLLQTPVEVVFEYTVR